MYDPGILILGTILHAPYLLELPRERVSNVPISFCYTLYSVQVFIFYVVLRIINSSHDEEADKLNSKFQRTASRFYSSIRLELAEDGKERICKNPIMNQIKERDDDNNKSKTWAFYSPHSTFFSMGPFPPRNMVLSLVLGL
jgi:hypothetical protein